MESLRINAEPWEPPSGMVKLCCEECDFYFAAPPRSPTVCPDCCERLYRNWRWHRDG